MLVVQASIKEKVNGLKFEKEDIFDLVEKVKEIQKNKKLKEKIIKTYLKSIVKIYATIVKKYISFFEKFKINCVELLDYR